MELDIQASFPAVALALQRHEAEHGHQCAGDNSGTAVTSSEPPPRPSIQVVFKPPLSWPIVLVVETSDSVVFPMLAMDRWW